MAAITPNKKDGKIVSYKFRACVGRDEAGKQIFRCTTWKVPTKLSPAKADKAANRAAELWEKEVRGCFSKIAKYGCHKMRAHFRN